MPADSALIGQEVNEVDLFKREGVRLIDVLRGDASLRRDLAGVELAAGDRVVLRTEMAELLGLQQNHDVRMVDELSSVQTKTVEVLITPGCRMIGRSLGSMRLRRRYGVYPLAVHRRNQNIGRQLDDLVVRVGDTLLLEGASADIERLAVRHGTGRYFAPRGTRLPPQAGPDRHRRPGRDRGPVGAWRRADPGLGSGRRGRHPADPLHRRGRGVLLRRRPACWP